MAALTFRADDGTRLAASSWGSSRSPTVLLVHGAGQTRHAWRDTARRIAEFGWHAVAVDLRGHGDSDWSRDGRYEIESFVGDLRSVADQLGSPVLVGASLGGTIALVAVGESDRRFATALVLVDIVTRPNPTGAERVRTFMRSGLAGFASLEEAADAVATYLPSRERPTDLSGLRKNLRQRDDGRWVWHWDPAFLIPVDERSGQPTRLRVSAQRLDQAAERVSIPTFLVRGGASDVVTDDGEAHLLKLIPAARSVVVPAAGHMVAGDQNDRFADAVLEFLNGPDVARR